MSSHLECFTVESCNQKLLKLVKHVNVQVSDSQHRDTKLI